MFWGKINWRTIRYQCIYTTLQHISRIKVHYHLTSNISRAEYLNLNICRLVVQLSLLNPLKPGIKSRMKMYRRCSNHIWVINNFIAHLGAYIFEAWLYFSKMRWIRLQSCDFFPGVNVLNMFYTVMCWPRRTWCITEYQTLLVSDTVTLIPLH